ncbi:hypothetical protein ABPG72_019710 [Tetrahymena utriculariae]
MNSLSESQKPQQQILPNFSFCQDKQMFNCNVNENTANQQPQKISSKIEEKPKIIQKKYVLEKMHDELIPDEQQELRDYEWIQSTNEEEFQIMKNVCYLEQFLDMYDDLQEKDLLHLDIPQFMKYLENSESESESILSDGEEMEDQFEDNILIQDVNTHGQSESRLFNPNFKEEQGVKKIDEFQMLNLPTNNTETMSADAIVKNNKHITNMKNKGKNQMSQNSIDSQREDDIYSQINQKGKAKRYQSSLALLAQEQFIRISKYGDIALTQNIARKNPKSDDFYDQEDSFIDDDQVDTELKQLAICEADYDDFFMVEGGLQDLVKSCEFRERLKDIQEYRDTKKIENHLKTDKKEKQPNPKPKIHSENYKNQNENEKKQQALNLLMDAEDEEDDKQMKKKKKNVAKNKKQFDLLHLKQPTFQEEIIQDTQNANAQLPKPQQIEKQTKNQKRVNQKSTKNSCEQSSNNNIDLNNKNAAQQNAKAEGENSNKISCQQSIKNIDEQNKQSIHDQRISQKRTKKSSNPYPDNPQKIEDKQQQKKKMSTQRPEQQENQYYDEKNHITIIIDDEDEQPIQNSQRNSTIFDKSKELNQKTQNQNIDFVENQSTPAKLEQSVNKNKPNIQINVSSSKKQNEDSNNFCQPQNKIRFVKTLIIKGSQSQLKDCENQVKTRSQRNESKAVSQQEEDSVCDILTSSKNNRAEKQNKDGQKFFGNLENNSVNLQDIQINKRRGANSVDDKQISQLKNIRQIDEISQQNSVKKSLSLVNSKVFLEEQPLELNSKADKQLSQKLKRKIVNPKKKEQSDLTEIKDNRKSDNLYIQQNNSNSNTNQSESMIDKLKQNIDQAELKVQKSNKSKKVSDKSQEADVMVLQKNITKTDKRKRDKDIAEEATITAQKSDKRIKE